MNGTRASRLAANAEGMDAIVIVNGGDPFLDSTFWYLSEQSSGVFEGSIAIVSKDGTLDIITSILEEEDARSGAGNIHIYNTREEREKMITDILGKCSTIGINAPSAVYASITKLQSLLKESTFVDASSAISSTVAVKDEKEIEATRRACKISSKVAGELPEYLHEGITEKEVASIMDNRMRELGGSGNAFDTIAAFGANSSLPHHTPSDYALKKGDTVLFDFGTKFDRYCSDMTRTMFFGEPPEVLKRAYDIVLRAQIAGIEEYYDGAPAKNADIAARKIIDDSEFKGRFIHTYGHGIGMEVHQDISVYSKSEQILKTGNVVSAEPGVYLQGIGGIRIEDTCLIKEKGCEKLTSFDHEMTIL